MFIHWGAYSVVGRGEWVRSAEKLTAEQYQVYVDQFVPREWNPEDWADLAVESGVKYAVLTAKHHDGFCLFDSALTSYSTMHNGLGRDLVAEFLDAFRARGIRVGLYFSLLDWAHPDYPDVNDEFHPLRGGRGGEPSGEKDFHRYVDYLHGQVEELCTSYGALDLLWFDFSYGELTGEAWRATELVRMIRAAQPGIVINNRLEASGSGYGSLITDSPTEWSGDYVSPEQVIPLSTIVDSAGDDVPWETCLTLNNSWGYTTSDTEWKSEGTVIRALVDCVSKGGNLLLNVGPDAHGRIPQASADVLRGVGSWLRSNSASVFGCGPAGLGRPEFGRYTRRGSTVFAHVWEQPIGPLALSGMDSKSVGAVSHEADGSEVSVAHAWVREASSETPFIGLGPVAHHSYPLSDPRDTVIRIEEQIHKSGS